MSQEKKEVIIKHIRREVCGFGSLHVALRVFRRLTGNKAIRERSHLITHLKSLSEEALTKLSQDLDIRLEKVSYP